MAEENGFFAGASDFLGKIVDRGLGVFDRVIDLELGDDELDLAKNLKLVKNANAAEQAERQASFADALTGGSGTVAGIDTKILLGGALVLFLGVLLYAATR
ncbi:MAG: hypothetical protein MI806_34250 [Minwuiales bacterium]|nr:hypothetical protein [Minwuiales bacterium]